MNDTTNIYEKKLREIFSISQEKMYEIFGENIVYVTEKQLKTILEDTGKEMIQNQMWDKYYMMMVRMNDAGIEF